MFDLEDDNSLIDVNENNKNIINDTNTDTINTISYNENSFLSSSKSDSNEEFNNLTDLSDHAKFLFRNFFDNHKNLFLVTYPELKERKNFIKTSPIQKIKAALLQKVDNPRAKDFNFKFSPEQDYYFFITKEINFNYMKPIIPATNKKKKMGKRAESISEEPKDKDINKIENKRINLSFDYNKYVLKAFIVYEKNNKLEIFHEEILNREICQVSHTTKESIDYYKNAKQIKQPKEKKNFEDFRKITFEKYYLIEVEKKKPASETIIKEDGILSVIYLITSEKKTAINLFTMVKYSLYFIEETLCNYIGKYIRDMIYDFCHLPSECFDDFLSHIGSVKKQADTYELVFPLKKYIKDIETLTRKNLISHVHRNLPNIIKPKATDKIPFHKFIFLYEKYRLYYEEKEFKIKQKYFNSDKDSKKKKYTKKFLFLKDCLIKDPVNDKITKENKLDLNMLLKIYFEILEKFLKERLSTDREIIQDFLVKNLAKFLSQYSGLKGFFNIDIVMNEDNVFEFQCSHNKAFNRNFNICMFKSAVQCLRGINFIFGFNEGFFHKHLTIMEYSYNFNEKDVVHTFLSINDSSKKNKIRIYDIPFMDNWCYQIASLLMTIYRDSFGFLCNKDYLSKQKTSIDFHDNFAKLFSDIHKNITKDLFDNYKKVIPNFYEFCSKMSETPLDKYNCLDNLCQNFANKSIQYLLKNNVIFFSPFEVVFEKEIQNVKNNLINEPNLNVILEPYLILVDNKLKLYLDQKEKKDDFLKDNHFDIKEYFKKLKLINIEKPHYTVFLTNQRVKDEDKDSDKDDTEDEKDYNLIETSSKKDKDNENNLERSESFSSTISEVPNLDKPININEVYPKKKRMHILQMKKISKPKNIVPQFDFYFLFNLYFNFTYEAMKSLKASFGDYDTLKRYIASIESSVTISFNDYDKTIMNKINPKKGESSDDAKMLKKEVKKNIIKDLTIMAKLTRMCRHMNCIFIQYMKQVIYNIIEGNKKIQDKIGNAKEINDGKDYFMKIGHYLVNFKAYRHDYDSFEYFKKSAIKKKIESEQHYLNAFEQKQNDK